MHTYLVLVGLTRVLKEEEAEEEEEEEKRRIRDGRAAPLPESFSPQSRAHNLKKMQY